MEAVLDAEQPDDFQKFLLERALAAPEITGDFDVSEGGERRQQIVSLEDEADLSAPQAGALAVGELRQLLPIDDHLAGGDRGEPADDVKQRRLAGARRTDDADELAAGHFHGDAAKRVHVHFAHVVDLAEVANDDDRFHSLLSFYS